MLKIILCITIGFICLLQIGAFTEEYIIGPGDVLDITVWKEEGLSKTYSVDIDGVISMPFLKEVRVCGLTTKGAADFITERLKNEGYLVSPVVTVSIKEYRSQRVMVFGTVKKPGAYYLKGKTMVLDFLSQIEQTEGQSGSKMVILRRQTPNNEEETVNVDLHALVSNGDLTQNIEILGGDKIIISRVISSGQQIYILGEVAVPGPYTIERDMTVLEALRMAGGLTDFANKGKVKIIREKDGKKKAIIINLGKVQKGDKSQDITLQGGDVLVALKSWF